MIGSPIFSLFGRAKAKQNSTEDAMLMIEKLVHGVCPPYGSPAKAKQNSTEDAMLTIETLFRGVCPLIALALHCTRHNRTVLLI
jgi:hypothetical protein